MGSYLKASRSPQGAHRILVDGFVWRQDPVQNSFRDHNLPQQPPSASRPPCYLNT